MLDIISMITFLFIFIGLPMILIIIGGNDKTEEEQDDFNGEILENTENIKENEKGETGYGRKTRRNNRTGYRSAGDL